MSEPDPEQLASELAEAVRRGDDPADLADDGGIEQYREAAALIRRLNRSPRPEADAGLQLTDDELWVIDRQFRRADALAALYEADVRRAEPEVEDLSQAAATLVTGVWMERRELDEAIGSVATAWRVERMPPVDRGVLRLALWELRHRRETPTAVVIAEAVRLAKAYSTERSGSFVNGVLSRLAAQER